MKIENYIAFFCVCLISLQTQAQETLYNERSTDPSIITRSTSYGIGMASVFDNYLSPQAYKGVELRISRESIHAASWAPEEWKIQTYFQGYVDYANNRAENNNTVAGVANWNYGLHRLVYETPNFQLLVGGVADLNGGFIYNMRNGNNPANVRLHANIDASVRLLWHTHIKRVPFLLRYQLNVPLTGLMFSPHYGQSYYEIFSRGNYDHNIVPTTFISAPTMRQLFTIDWHTGKKWDLRVGYLGNYQQAQVNNLKQHVYTHRVLIGIARSL